MPESPTDTDPRARPDSDRSGNPDDDPVAAMRDAARTYRETADRVDDVGETEMRRVADAYDRVTRVLDGYEERATDWDDFEGYIEFREALSNAVEALGDDLPHREAFEEADRILKTGGVSETLSASDFERARETLAPARELAALREEHRAAESQYRTARRALRDHRDALAERVAELERLVRLGEADLDAPVERLRDPIRRYNTAVRNAFRDFTRDASARELLAFVERTDAYPLVDYRQPPDRLASYVRNHDAGTEPVGQLLEYADYSRSKLDHYVDDPQALKAAVATNRTYLDRLDAEPLTVGWPPPTPGALRYRVRELVPVVGRLDDDAVAALRSVRELADDPGYETLRESAVAREELSADERAMAADGTADRDLDRARDDLDRVRDALSEHPPVGQLS